MFDTPSPPPARSKVELLYQEVLRESSTLLGRIEQVTQRQNEIQQSLQALPNSLRQAGLQAATQAADHANRSLLDATRTLARAASDLRVAAMAVGGVARAGVWRNGLLCAASAFGGSLLCAALVLLFARA